MIGSLGTLLDHLIGEKLSALAGATLCIGSSDTDSTVGATGAEPGSPSFQ